MNPQYIELIHFTAGLIQAMEQSIAVLPGVDVARVQDFVAMYTEHYLQSRFGCGLEVDGKQIQVN